VRTEARHAQQRVGGGQKAAAAAAPFSVRDSTAVGCLLSTGECCDQVLEHTRTLPCGHLNIAQIMRGASPDTSAGADVRIIFLRYVWVPASKPLPGGRGAQRRRGIGFTADLKE